MKKNIAGKIPENEKHLHPHPVKKSPQRDLDEVIDGCREQDVHSQEKLYKKFYGYALGIALTYTSSKGDANEVVNDSFMKVFKSIKTYNSELPFKPWFRTIVVNTSIDKARANKKFKREIKIDDYMPSSSVDVEADLNAKQIYNLLDELPDLLRFVFNMYEIEGYSHREISGKLDIAESSSRTYLTRAKAQLRELYRNNFSDSI